jgi:hypothetical protein
MNLVETSYCCKNRNEPVIAIAMDRGREPHHGRAHTPRDAIARAACSETRGIAAEAGGAMFSVAGRPSVGSSDLTVFLEFREVMDKGGVNHAVRYRCSTP